MIPYFYYPTISLGFFHINTWGIFAALGFGLAIFIAWKHSLCRAQNSELVFDLSFWLIISAILGARLFHIFLYDWSFYKDNLGEIVKLWHGGLSSFGGFFGAGLCGFIYLRKKKFNFLRYADTFIYSLPAGLFVGRVGCFLIHDHPGTLSNFILAVKYPNGARHDLGLYLGIFDIILFTAFLVIEKTRFGVILFKGQPKNGFYLTCFLIVYGVARFFLDFLRTYDLAESDARYGGLTPAQYGSIVLFGIGLFLAFKIKNKFISNNATIKTHTNYENP